MRRIIVLTYLLDDHPSTVGGIPVSGEGTLMKQSTGAFQYIHSDQLEVSPDGKYWYYQPASGSMSRIETSWADKALYNSSLNSNSILGEYVEPYSNTPSTGGTAIDADGNIYVSDTDRQASSKDRFEWYLNCLGSRLKIAVVG